MFSIDPPQDESPLACSYEKCGKLVGPLEFAYALALKSHKFHTATSVYHGSNTSPFPHFLWNDCYHAGGCPKRERNARLVLYDDAGRDLGKRQGRMEEGPPTRASVYPRKSS